MPSDGARCLARTPWCGAIRRVGGQPGGGRLSKTDAVDQVCPEEGVDTLLWRNAQRILRRHVIRLDGTCHWCGRRSPCAAQAVAPRADAVPRLPLHEAWAARDELTRLLPVLSMADPPGPRAHGPHRTEPPLR